MSTLRNDVSEDGNKVIQNISTIQQYINGEFVNSSSHQTFTNYNPYTNEPINEVASGNDRDIDIAVAAAKKAFNGEWGRLSIQKRMVYLNKIADLIDEHIEEIAPLESYDTGLPLKQTKKNGRTRGTEL